MNVFLDFAKVIIDFGGSSSNFPINTEYKFNFDLNIVDLSISGCITCTCKTKQKIAARQKEKDSERL